jgi:hypothetical protein
MNETELIVRIDRIYKEYEDSKRFDCKCRVYYKNKNDQDKKIKIGSFQIQANENENKIDIKKSKKLTYRFQTSDLYLRSSKINNIDYIICTWLLGKYL